MPQVLGALDLHGMKNITDKYRRWLVHSIATYYDLHAWSVTVGNPARREAYVGIKQMKTGTGRSSSGGELPMPLWCMV